MPARAWLLLVSVGVALGTATSGPPGQVKVGPRLSQDECRRIAADSLGVRPEDLQEKAGGVVEEVRTTSPPFWVFTIPYKDSEQAEEWQRERGRVRIRVNAWDGQVMDVHYSARQLQVGEARLGEGDARRSAEAYLKSHWSPWPRARFLSAHREDNKGTPFPPEWLLKWVAEENGIRVGLGDLTVNGTTGEVVEYSQRYYPAKGLPPPRLGQQDALRKAQQAVAEREPGVALEAELGDSYLMTTWRSGNVRLAWSVRLRAGARSAEGGQTPQRGRMYDVVLDAQTGEVYNIVAWHGNGMG